MRPKANKMMSSHIPGLNPTMPYRVAAYKPGQKLPIENYFGQTLAELKWWARQFILNQAYDRVEISRTKSFKHMKATRWSARIDGDKVRLVPIEWCDKKLAGKLFPDDGRPEKLPETKEVVL